MLGAILQPDFIPRAQRSIRCRHPRAYLRKENDRRAVRQKIDAEQHWPRLRAQSGQTYARVQDPLRDKHRRGAFRDEVVASLCASSDDKQANRKHRIRSRLSQQRKLCPRIFAALWCLSQRLPHECSPLSVRHQQWRYSAGGGCGLNRHRRRPAYRSCRSANVVEAFCLMERP